MFTRRSIISVRGPAGALLLASVAAAGPRDGSVTGARTRDGLKLEEVSSRLVESGREPDVLLLTRATPSRNGPDAGALLGYVLVQEGRELVRVTSIDQGRSWSSADAVSINGWPKDLDGLKPAGPAAVQLDDGRIRLYFTAARPMPSSPAPGTLPPGRPMPRNEGAGAQPGTPPWRDGQPGSRPEPPARIYSAISNDGVAFAFEDGHRFELAGVSDPEVLRLPDAKPSEEDARRIGPWLMFFTRDDSTLLATSRDGLTFTRDETFVWTSARHAGAALAAAEGRAVRLYAQDKSGIISALFEPATGELKIDHGPRIAGSADDPSAAPCGDGVWLLVSVRSPADKPGTPGRLPKDPGRRPDDPLLPAPPARLPKPE